MAKINILPPSVFNRIAAGEVVDRPYSIVKELVENAIDAGASEIEIRIEKGGKSYISVQDNGEGVEYADLKSLFLPHATSKIANADDLESVVTLGFRGEAVASIAAVSRTSYTSKRENGECYKIECNGGEIGVPTVTAGGEKGTLAEVSDLFYNTPVRLKFLKSDKAEEGDISTFINRFMLSHPEISFKYFVDNRLTAQSFGGGEEEVLAAVYGASILANTFHIRAIKNGIKIEGYIGNQNFFKPNKSCQSVFLNGRYILNQTIATAVNNAYASYAMKRQFPFYVLHITMPSEVVDVNVHPNKADVRFADNQVVFGTIYSVISAVLDGSAVGLNYVLSSENADRIAQGKKESDLRRIIPTPSTVERSFDISSVPPAQNNPFGDSGRAESRGYEPKSAFKLFAADQKEDVPFPKQDKINFAEEIEKSGLNDWKQRRQETKSKPSDNTQTARSEDLFFSENTLSVNKKAPAVDRSYGDNRADNNPAYDAYDAYEENKKYLAELEEKRIQAKIDVDRAEYKGNLFNTFLIYEAGETVYLIDQHAAHERLIFNRLKEQMEQRKIIQQPMLIPYELLLTPSEDVFMYDCLPVLKEIGFDIAESGVNRYTINAVPMDLQCIALDEFFAALLKDISDLKQIKLSDLLKDKLAMMACKAAVKGGMRLTEKEVAQLIADMKGDISLKCPHGRPVVVALSKYEIEKMFKRIV